MSLTYEEARIRLAACQQEQLLEFWSRLNAGSRQTLLGQIAALDLPLLVKMKESLPGLMPASIPTNPMAEVTPVPPESLSKEDRVEARDLGEQALRRGEVGVLLVAGGQGTRLGFEGPKGTFALGPLSKASLFAIHARKILACRRTFGKPLPFYVMTSQANDAETRAFFDRNNFFGLPSSEVCFFAQGMYPALWPDGRIVLEAPDRLFQAPDGHGGVLAALQRTGMLDDMCRRGVKNLFYFQVDNPLVEIADPEFIGLHLRAKAQMSLKVCAKRDPEEGMGVVVRRGGEYAMVEYTELTREQKHARDAAGELKFKYGSVAIHVFDLEFLAQEARIGLPLHSAHKKVPFCDAQGCSQKTDRPNAYKFEKFIFDALPDARRVLVVDFDRTEEFSPVKNASGPDSPDTARADMMSKWARWMVANGIRVPRTPDGGLQHRIEIDACYAVNAVQLGPRLPPGFVWAGDLDLRGEP
jgi:UDP-N-acetylglucosamine/UDP-N-acetylgalactosamine diphosphorylase